MATAIVTANERSMAHRQSNEVFVTRQEAARILTISCRTLDKEIRSGRLEAFRIAERVLIERRTLMKFAKRISACGTGRWRAANLPHHAKRSGEKI